MNLLFTSHMHRISTNLKFKKCKYVLIRWNSLPYNCFNKIISHPTSQTYAPHTREIFFNHIKQETIFLTKVHWPEVNVCRFLSIVIVVHLGGEGCLVDPWDGGGENPRGGVQTARPAHRVDRQRQAAVPDRRFQGRPALVVLPTVGNLTKERVRGSVKERVQLKPS